MHNIVIVYHAHCNDGLMAAAIVREARGAKGNCAMDIIPGYHNDPPKLHISFEGKEVYFVDFCWDDPHIMASIASLAKSTVVLDHHKTAIEATKNITEGNADVIIASDDASCGALLAWKYFYGEEPPPRVIDLIFIRDTFAEDPGEDAHAFFLATEKLRECNDVRAFVKILSCTEEELCRDWLEPGHELLKAHREKVEEVVGTSETAVDEDGLRYYATVVTDYALISDVAAKLLERHPDADYVMITKKEEDRGGAKISLRSRKGGVDVAEIAKKHGGGGHPQAAGYIKELND